MFLSIIRRLEIVSQSRSEELLEVFNGTTAKKEAVKITPRPPQGARRHSGDESGFVLELRGNEALSYRVPQMWTLPGARSDQRRKRKEEKLNKRTAEERPVCFYNAQASKKPKIARIRPRCKKRLVEDSQPRGYS